MPKWTPETDAKLLAAIIKTTDAKFDLSTVANLMSIEGDECTVKALTHRIAKIKGSAKEYWPDDVAASAANVPAPQPKITRKRKGKAVGADDDDDASAVTPGSTAKKARTAAIKNEDDEAPETPTKKGGRKAGGGGRKKKADTAVAETVIKTEVKAEEVDGADKQDAGEANGEGNGATEEDDEKPVRVGVDG